MSTASLRPEGVPIWMMPWGDREGETGGKLVWKGGQGERHLGPCRIH